MAATMRVSSSLSFGSEGVAMVSESLRSLSLRAVTGSSERPSKRVACLAYSTVAAMARSSSLAESA